MDKLEEILGKIEAHAKAYTYTSSWSFLFTGKHTFCKNQKLIFVGLNPGGRADKCNYLPVRYNENGHNDYLEADDWGKGIGKTPLQRQVISLFEGIARQLGVTHESLMHETMAANFIPFRSQDWDKVENGPQCMLFAKELWRDIIDYTNPAVIISMNRLAHESFLGLVEAKDTLNFETKWGSTTASFAEYTKRDGKKGLLVRVPHLSRYRIFKREKSQNCTDQIVQKIASYYKE